ncbi:kexin [Schizosaccharomyces japonicus yFS275]|uniref:Kexin n=1 Tax=Schizosaccharomyces japonicus (strain yFS275 / FY16936) TaxID=402676 RepID=B6K6Q9_SCHJY|nr:kexin [Schizosaccharomyces japonicus yFS275]EEB09213.1 kexin [Schizosaccharomyces japonicus yFS275]
MRLLQSLAAVLLLLAGIGSAQPLDNVPEDLFVASVTEGTSPEALAEFLGGKFVRRMRNLPNYFVYSVPRTQLKKRTLQRRDLPSGVIDVQKQHWKRRYKRDSFALEDPLVLEVREKFDINDPLLSQQWHIINTNAIGHDLNVTGVWEEGYLGENVTVAFVDDGLDFRHADLQDAFSAVGSWDFNDDVPEPLPKLADDTHGTRCAGEVAAAWNDVCGVGIAPKAKVAGLRMLSGPVTDLMESEALNYGFDTNDIYSCSWGPADDGRAMEAPEPATRKALLNGVVNGRNGLGSVFVFASGNGGYYDDNCNFDGYTNSIFSVTVGAVDTEDSWPAYGEYCAAQLVSAYSSGHNRHIVTTNVDETCTHRHGGTSAAAPLGSAVYALALSARPELTWRDIQHITVYSALPFHTDDESHKFGFGKLDAGRFIETAKHWELVKPQTWYITPLMNVNASLSANETDTPHEVHLKFNMTRAMVHQSNIQDLEHVTVRTTIPFSRRGKLQVVLRSPSDVESVLATERPFDENAQGIQDWTFMTVQHWGEKPEGVWTLIVRDLSFGEHHGQVNNWQLGLWGQASNASQTRTLNFDPISPPQNGSLGSIVSSYTYDAGAVSANSTTSSISSSPTASSTTLPNATTNGTNTTSTIPSEESGKDNTTAFASFLGALASSLHRPVVLIVLASVFLCLGLSVILYVLFRKRKSPPPVTEESTNLLRESEV